MGLTQLNFEGRNKVEVAIMRLQQFQPSEGYFLAFSGGKDSVVIYDLAIRAGVKFDAHYNITGIDPPELVKFIRQNYPLMTWEKPLESIWSLVARKGLPRRNSRYCCEYLKEHSGAGRTVVTGIRWAESARRHKRKMVESCRWVKAKFFIHPIIDWSASEVWEYIKMYALPYCSLYDEGFHRLGCILCPMTTKAQAERDIARWPKIAEAWFRATVRYFNTGAEATKKFESPEALFQWWISRKSNKPQDELHTLFV